MPFMYDMSFNIFLRVYAAAFSLASFNFGIQQDQQACEILSFSSSVDICADD